MKAAVNIGNTHIVCGVATPNGVKAHRTPTDTADLPTALQYAAEQLGLTGAAESITVCSVVPGRNKAVAAALEQAFGTAPRFIGVDTPLGLDLSAYDTSLLGADRLAACAAAFKKYGAPLIVFDLGTALTANVVAPGGRFLGGAILPGMALGLSALGAGTSLLPTLRPQDEIPLIGSDTKSGMLTGAVLGAACFIDGYTARIAKSHGWQPTIVLTGGGAKGVSHHLETPHQLEPELVLQGLLGL